MRELDKRNEDAPASPAGAGAATPGKSPLLVQRSGGAAAPSDPAVVQPIAEQGVAGGGGEVPFRSQMEQGFGVPLGGVSFHAGAEAASASRAIGADAYTVGSSIAMAAPATPQLVAHEVAHVVQQQAGAGPSSGVGAAGDSFEREADHAAETVASGGTTDLATRYGAVASGMGAAVQRRAVQRYESGEHALLGAGPNYPVMSGNVTLPNGAQVISGELVAFGDFYSDMVQLQEAPRQEVEALAGICRLEAVWYQARRMAAQGRGTATDAQSSLVANQAAFGSGGNTEGTPAVPGAKSPSGPSASHLQTLPKIDGANPVWSDPKATIGTTGVSVAECRQRIFNQFAAVWKAFNISFDLNSLPETGVGILRATIGRRRFRGTNDALPNPRDDFKWKPNENEGPAKDPGHLGGDYLDLAQNNLSHFSPDNFHHWANQHERACEAHKKAKDDGGRAMALASDNFGAHFLTDRFSTGHFVDKAELMTYATSMMVDTARGNVAGSAEMSHDELLRTELKNAVSACFDDPSVMHQWEEGVNEAIKNQTVTRAEGLAMRNLSASMVSDMITDVLMESPWRTYEQGRGPVEEVNEKGAGGRSGHDLSRGQGPVSKYKKDAKADGKTYQLGVGNLAALQVHDALNAIGFTVENGMGDRWRCQGDDHLQAKTMAVANACVAASQAQVKSGKSNPDGIKQYIPKYAWMDPAWIDDYFKGVWGNAELDEDRISKLKGMVKGAKIDLNIEGGHRDSNDFMTLICHQMMRILFMPKPPGPQSNEGDHGTGLNISMLKAFLIKRLEDMVSMAYAAASAADIPQAALELYAPKNEKGHTLPRAANNFTWQSAKALGFDLNVTGCTPGTYTVMAKCYRQLGGYDYDPSGLPGYGLVDAQERGRGVQVDDRNYAGVPVTVTVPPAAANADPNAQRRIPVVVAIPGTGEGEPTDRDFRYVIITGDPAGECNIGRSNAPSERKNANPAPADDMDRATGKDKTTSPLKDPKADRRMRGQGAEWSPSMKVHNKQFSWDGKTVTFRIEAATPAPFPFDGNVQLATFDHNWLAADKKVAEEEVGYSFRQGQTVSQPIVFTAQGDSPYIKVKANGVEIGESKRAGHDSGHADAPPASHGGAQAANNFVWNGKVLRFKVEPETAKEVFVKFDNAFQKGDLVKNPPDPAKYAVLRVPVVNGFGSADASNLEHNVSARIFADADLHDQIGESSNRF
jgi:hypothetical protein